MNASYAARAIAITSLIALAAAAPPQVRTAPRPVMQNPNAPRIPSPRPDQTGSPPPQPDQYTSLAFTVTTGDDDLRSDSKAWVDITYADQGKDSCILRTVNGDTWENNKPYDAPQCVLGAPKTFDQLKSAKIELKFYGPGDFMFKGQDNWNVDEVRIEAQNAVQHLDRCLIDASKRPYLVRMTGQIQTFDLSAAPSTC